MAPQRKSWPRATDDKNAIFLASLERAYRAGFYATRDAANDGKSLDELVSGVDFWAFDEPAPKAEKKPKAASSDDGEKPKAKKSSGAWVDDPALADKPFDPAFCNCRKWNGGWGAQCNREISDDGLCAMHNKQYQQQKQKKEKQAIQQNII